MKPILRLVTFLLVAALFSSCLKMVDKPQGQPANPLTGSWVASDADENDGYSWQSVSSGFETGIFDFYNNGSVTYSEVNTAFTGNWRITDDGGSFYDEYGNVYTGNHQSFEIQATDSYSGSTLNLYLITSNL